MKNKNTTKTKKAKVSRCKCLLAKVCETKEISIYKLGRDIGIHPNQVYTYSSGKTVPSIEIALSIAKALNVDVNDIWVLI